MIQTCRQLGFMYKHVAEACIARETGQNLFYDAKARGSEFHLLARKVNFRHPTLANEIEQV